MAGDIRQAIAYILHSPEQQCSVQRVGHLEEPFETFPESSSQVRAVASDALDGDPFCKTSRDIPWSDLFSGAGAEEEDFEKQYGEEGHSGSGKKAGESSGAEVLSIMAEVLPEPFGESEAPAKTTKVPRVELKAIISMNSIAESREAMLSNIDASGFDEFMFGACAYNEQLQEEVYCSSIQPKSQSALAKFKALVSLPKAISTTQGKVEQNLECLPVKHTFIHYDTPTSLGRRLTPRALTRCSSAPSMMMSRPFALIQPSLGKIHSRGDCRPCAYHQNKEDGCRWGAKCKFCHLCPPGEIKKRKKEKLRARRVQPYSRVPSRHSSTAEPPEVSLNRGL
mmetsp:Transcript_17237/g.31810  ORF Transcript_17237/g.31810 Transcript_17237/m.31810 type:complete len:338 (+) Transcript_17237:112-1125(+)